MDPDLSRRRYAADFGKGILWRFPTGCREERLSIESVEDPVKREITRELHFSRIRDVAGDMRILFLHRGSQAELF